MKIASQEAVCLFPLQFITVSAASVQACLNRYYYWHFLLLHIPHIHFQYMAYQPFHKKFQKPFGNLILASIITFCRIQVELQQTVFKAAVLGAVRRKILIMDATQIILFVGKMDPGIVN